MVHTVASRLRERIDTGDVGGLLFVAALWVLGVDATVVAVVLVTVLTLPVADLALERVDLHPGLYGVAFGGAAVAAGVVQLRAGGYRIGAALSAVGAWICLDGVDRWRNEEPSAGTSDDDVSKEAVFLLNEHNRWLIEELREADRPLTRAEIRSRTGLSADDLERLLDHHGESGPIERVGNGYTIAESELGAVAFVRNLVGTIGGRLRRPFRLLRPAG